MPTVICRTAKRGCLNCRARPATIDALCRPFAILRAGLYVDDGRLPRHYWPVRFALLETFLPTGIPELPQGSAPLYA